MKHNLDIILQSLKNNTKARELNLGNNNFDDNDLNKIAELIRADRGINKLKLSNNKFT